MILVPIAPRPKILCLGCLEYFYPEDRHNYADCCQYSAWLEQQERAMMTAELVD